MLQRDIATPDMDVRYVSALSWYFLNLFGLNGLFKLMLGSENGTNQSADCLHAGETDLKHFVIAADGSRDMGSQAMMAGAAMGPMAPGKPDIAKLHKAEADNFAIAEGMYVWAGEGVEERVLRLFGKQVEFEAKKTR